MPRFDAAALRLHRAVVMRLTSACERPHPGMRLSPDPVHALVAAAPELAGADARVRPFGSRVNDRLRGGDIDLWVARTRPLARPVRLAAQITARLAEAVNQAHVAVPMRVRFVQACATFVAARRRV